LVVKLQLTGEVIGLPAKSRTPVEITTEYDVLPSSETEGVKVAVLLAASYLTEALTTVVPPLFRTMKVLASIDVEFIASENTAVTDVVVETFCAPGAGLRLTTVGGVVSPVVKLQVSELASGIPEESRTAVLIATV
jgi:hypothetical protein